MIEKAAQCHLMMVHGSKVDNYVADLGKDFYSLLYLNKGY